MDCSQQNINRDDNESFLRTSLTVSVAQYTQLERSCLTNARSHSGITVDLSKKQAVLADWGLIVSSQRVVRNVSKLARQVA